MRRLEQQSRLIVKVATDIAPRYAVVLPVAPDFEAVCTMAQRLQQLIAFEWSDELLKTKGELWLLCEGQFAGVSDGSQCTSREPIQIERYHEWVQAAAPCIKYAVMVLGIMSKVGLGMLPLRRFDGRFLMAKCYLRCERTSRLRYRLRSSHEGFLSL